ncbi:MAG: invasion associated locus B family protein [Pseudomonadota bacterium]
MMQARIRILTFGILVPGILTLICMAWLWPAIGFAQSTASHGDWNANVSQSGDNGKACTMWSQPDSAEGDYKRRGEIYAFLTHWPAINRRGEFSLQMGYRLREQSVVEVAIGTQQFSMAAFGNFAYADGADTNRLLNALRGGTVMTVKGISWRGTVTTDRYSLIGFTRMLNWINQQCA